MRAPAWTAALLLLLCAPPASAQLPASLHDTFTDGDLTSAPRWSGSDERWAVDTLDGQPALRSDGRAARDTIYLSTPLAVSYGRWSFTFAHAGVNLSTFNGARVYLVADAADLRDDLRGYYVQLGTNNNDEIRLYRQDAGGARVELGRSTPLLSGDDAVIRLEVTRSSEDEWEVKSDGVPVLHARDGTYAESRTFGFWVKHTPEARRAFFFDEIVVEGTPGPVDDAPPTLLEAVWRPDSSALRLTFSEPLDPATLAPTAFSVSGAGAPSEVRFDAPHPQQIYLLYDPPPGEGVQVISVTGVADLAGNVIAAGTRMTFEMGAPASEAVAPGEVVINEIMYAPTAGVPEFVELYNRSGRPVDLRRLSLSDAQSDPAALTATPAMLAPEGFVVVTGDSAAFRAAFPGVAFVSVARWPSLNNSGDVVVLASGDTEIDAVHYEPGWGGTAGTSLERIDPAGPSTSRRNFASSTDPAGATPGRTNSRFAPDATPPSVRRAVESADGVIEIVFTEPVDTLALSPDVVRLNDRTATAVATPSDTVAVAYFDPPARGGLLQVSALRDLSGNTAAAITHSVAARPRPGELVFNEIMFAPLADRFDARPDQPEYVELVNRSPHVLALNGLAWAGPPDERGSADTLLLVPDHAAVAPGGFAVVYAAPAPLPDPIGAIAEAFPALSQPGEAVVLLPLRRTSLGLANTGDHLTLLRRDGAVLEAMAYDPRWHDPALRTATGVSLERTTLDAPATLRTSWASSTAPAGGTPGQPNSVRRIADARAPAPGELVVNEILFAPLRRADDGLADQPEFVELHNISSASLDMNGLFWTDAPDEQGKADTLRFSTVPRSLPPGGFAVVFSVSASDAEPPRSVLVNAFPGVPEASVALPLRRALGLRDGGGLVRLHGPDGAVLDEVAYASSWHHPGLAATTGVSLERLDPHGPSDAAPNWSSSLDPAGATPGAPNSLLRAAAAGSRPGVVVEPSPFSIERDGVAAIRFTLRSSTSLVRARVFDDAGRLARTLTDAALAGATGQLQWDGLGDDGRRLPIGIYIVLLEAVDARGGTSERYRAPVVLARPLD